MRRCRPATPTSSTRSTAAPNTRAVSAASAATGPSEVPAASTATVPRPGGSGPTATAVPSTVTSSCARRSASTVSARRAGDEHRAVAGRAQRLDDLEHLRGRLAGAVDDLGVAGAQGAVHVDQRVRQLVVGRGRELVERVGGVEAAVGDGLEQLLRLGRSTAASVRRVPRVLVGPAPRAAH